MICFIPDTNILLNCVKGNYEDDKFLSVLQSLVVNEKIILAIPEQVIIEWERNIDRTSESCKASFDNYLNYSKKFKKFVLPQTGEQFEAVISQIESQIELMHTHYIDRKINALNNLIESHAVIIPTSDVHKTIAADWALDKMAPFFGSRDTIENKNDQSLKNSTGDAIIFHSSVEHVKQSNYNKVFFISENHKDFCKAGSKVEIHENLEKILPDNMCFNTNLFKVMKEIISEVGYKYYTYEESLRLAEKFELAAERYKNNILYPNNTRICPRCSTRVDELNDGRWFHSIYGGGLSWWLQCTNCGLEWDTGEFYD